MALASAVEGSTDYQDITWIQLLTTPPVPLDLTGATITGILREWRSQITRAIAGTLDPTDPVNGVFRWTYSTADTLPLVYDVQFTATYPGSNPVSKTFQTTWYIEPCLVVVP